MPGLYSTCRARLKMEDGSATYLPLDGHVALSKVTMGIWLGKRLGYMPLYRIARLISVGALLANACVLITAITHLRNVDAQ